MVFMTGELQLEFRSLQFKKAERLVRRLERPATNGDPYKIARRILNKRLNPLKYIRE